MGLLGFTPGIYVKLDLDSCHFRFDPSSKLPDRNGFKQIPGSNVCASLKITKMVPRRLIVAATSERCASQMEKPRRAARKSIRRLGGGLRAALVNLHRQSIKKLSTWPDCMPPRHSKCRPVGSRVLDAAPEKVQKATRPANSLGAIYSKCVQHSCVANFCGGHTTGPLDEGNGTCV